MTDIELRKRVAEHYQDALKLYLEDRIVCLCLQGSQNYYLEDEESDVDTKLLVLPTLDEIIFNKKPISITHIRENGEHIDAKDIRLYWQCFRKGNPNFVEILFSRVVYVNPMYQDLWNIMVANAERIARINPLASAKAMMGMIQEKYHAMEHRYPSRAEIVDKFRYDPKQLSHLVRMAWFLKQYVMNRDYIDLIRLYGEEEEQNWKWHQYLIDVKRGRCYGLEQAREVADMCLRNAENSLLKAKEIYDGEEDSAVSALMDEVFGKMIKRAITKELEKECESE